MKTTYKLVFALIFLLAIGCDKDKFAELNTNPSTLSEPDLRYLMTTAIEKMYGNDYTIWFYNNFDYVYPWTQVTTLTGGNTPDWNTMGPTGGQSVNSIFPQTMDIRMRIDAMEDEDKAINQALSAMTYPIQIATAMTITDNTGSLIYTEAGLAPYTNPPLLTPVVDNQETLFNTWLEELNMAIGILNNTDGQINMGNQDRIYGGDFQRWGKYCNLLKLRIAARLVNKDRAKALKIAEEVFNSPVGYMDAISDDFIYRRGVKYHGNGNGLQPGYGGKNVIDFLMANKDPRVRFIYEKNHFNGEVVQAFIDAGKELPPFIAPLVKLDGEGNFDGWEGMGEPWVRYHGAPVSPDETQDAANSWYFNQGSHNKIDNKTYGGVSYFSEKLMRARYDYTYPTKPGGRVIQLKDNDPPLNIILGTAAETNLYLAEFKTLGANISKTAQELLNHGVTLSVNRANKIADLNQMPYYNGDPVYMDEDEAAAGATKLRAGEIDVLLASDVCDLSTDGLEKIYIQQYINFMNTPNDMWTLVRRSGIPKKGSAYLPWENFQISGSEAPLPRRFTVGTPTEDNINYANLKAAVDEQGFTTGTPEPTILATERLWFDQENPNYGEGPKN